MSGSAKSLFTARSEPQRHSKFRCVARLTVFAQSVDRFLWFVTEHVQEIKGPAVPKLDKECSMFAKCSLFKQSANQMI
jgi:hypothetical protein